MLCAWLLSEAGAVDDHDVFLADEFLYEDFIALRDIDSGVSIKSSARSHTTHSWRGLTPLLREVSPGTQLALHLDEMILRAFERRLDRVLFGMVRAETSAQQAMDALGVGLNSSGIAGNDAPSDTPSGHKVILRHATEGHARDVGSHRGKGNMGRFHRG